MSIGLGIAIAGMWMPVTAAFLSKSATGVGVFLAFVFALIGTAMSLTLGQ